MEEKKLNVKYRNRIVSSASFFFFNLSSRKIGRKSYALRILDIYQKGKEK